MFGGRKKRKKKQTLIQASLLSCVITYIGKSSTIRIRRSRRKRLEAAVVIAEGVEVGELIYNTSVYYAVHLHLLNVFSYEWKWIRLDSSFIRLFEIQKKEKKKNKKQREREKRKNAIERSNCGAIVPCLLICNRFSIPPCIWPVLKSLDSSTSLRATLYLSMYRIHTYASSSEYPSKNACTRFWNEAHVYTRCMYSHTGTRTQQTRASPIPLPTSTSISAIRTKRRKPYVHWTLILNASRATRLP